jgi:IS30 family transposase
LKSNHCSSAGTLVERTTGFVVLAKMDNATTKAVVDSFSAVPNREPAAMRKTMTYGQGREMHAPTGLAGPQARKTYAYSVNPQGAQRSAHQAKRERSDWADLTECRVMLKRAARAIYPGGAVPLRGCFLTDGKARQQAR